MAQTIVIASGKGGVGKSTITAGLGRALSDMGKKTLLVDCDAGLGALDTLLGCGENAAFTWLDVFSGGCEPAQAIIKINDFLSVTPAPVTLPDTGSDDAVRLFVNAVSPAFDVILIDAPAGIGSGLTRAASAAKFGIVVATGDEISVKGAAAVDKKLTKAGVVSTRLIINRYELKAAKKGRLLSVDKMIDLSYVRLIGIVPEDKNLKYHSTLKKNSPAFGAFERISKRILGENTPLTLSLLK
jgi:septum site-determining protein MinD